MFGSVPITTILIIYIYVLYIFKASLITIIASGGFSKIFWGSHVLYYIVFMYVRVY